MVKRRDLLSGGMLGGLLGAFAAPDAEAAEAGELSAAQRQPSPEGFKDIADAIASLRQEFASQYAFNDISAIRNAQRNFLRANQKMPDFIEVGAGLWFQLYDWHVRWQQTLNAGRDPQGHYTIVFMGTTVVLRPDNPDSFISAPYDLR